jgi:hypothetical protein
LQNNAILRQSFFQLHELYSLELPTEISAKKIRARPTRNCTVGRSTFLKKSKVFEKLDFQMFLSGGFRPLHLSSDLALVMFKFPAKNGENVVGNSKTTIPHPMHLLNPFPKVS